MKVTVHCNAEAKKRPFPKLMIAEDGEIVFMVAYGLGVVINNACGRLGKYNDDWAMEEFLDFTDSITLEND